MFGADFSNSLAESHNKFTIHTPGQKARRFQGIRCNSVS